jgi:preprotein translocase subunit SecG
MSTWINVIVVLHVVVALVIIGLVLLQHGKGADMGSGFGGGSSGSLFGATGSANFLSRTTAVLAAVFFALSLLLAYLATKREATAPTGVMDAVKSRKAEPAKGVPAPAEPAKPAAAPAGKDGSKDKAVPQ